MKIKPDRLEQKIDNLISYLDDERMKNDCLTHKSPGIES